MNVKLFMRIKKHILSEPRRFNMSTWCGKSTVTGKNKPPCGTTACIGGTAYWLTVKPSTFTKALRSGEQLETKAAKKLGITTDQARRLFFFKSWGFATGWPERFEDAYMDAKTPAGRARAAVRRIDHFLATEGRE